MQMLLLIYKYLLVEYNHSLVAVGHIGGGMVFIFIQKKSIDFTNLKTVKKLKAC